MPVQKCRSTAGTLKIGSTEVAVHQHRRDPQECQYRGNHIGWCFLYAFQMILNGYELLIRSSLEPSRMRLAGWFISNFPKTVKRFVSAHLRSYSAETLLGSFRLNFCVKNLAIRGGNLENTPKTDRPKIFWKLPTNHPELETTKTFSSGPEGAAGCPGDGSWSCPGTRPPPT